ncbi:MAG: acyl-CoA/acyl-ACP dehydrogenase [Deltaproteobacteria bacterium]|nr:acyl-CoA/acyl-ACP dehydrogenase [Deltaproteobacteria bacterium]MCL5277254.1 acyl-CoA/acyl-ACP dehydrogenase [Deltaproteobacteria bacterium]
MTNSVGGKNILTSDDRKAIEELAYGFVKKEIQSMFSHAGADGDLSRVPDILEQGARIGLLAEHGREEAGTGVWGTTTLSEGPALSIGLLKIISQTCGGVGACFHAAGLGSLAADMIGLDIDGRLACIMPDFDDLHVMPCLTDAETAYGRSSIRCDSTDAGHVIKGRKEFLLQSGRTTSYVLIVPAKAGNTYAWVAATISASDDRLKISNIQGQMGIRAVSINNIEIDNKYIDKQYVITINDKDYRYIIYAYHLIGLTAVLTGIAKGAIASAIKYARERYQGGDLIIKHPAIRFLIAESEARVMAIESMLEGVSGYARGDRSGDIRGLVKYAAALKWFGAGECVRAITDSLQVFGGYGYMEDYGMEKRLRDGQTLKSLSGSSVIHRHTVIDNMETLP